VEEVGEEIEEETREGSRPSEEKKKTQSHIEQRSLLLLLPCLIVSFFLLCEATGLLCEATGATRTLIGCDVWLFLSGFSTKFAQMFTVL